MHVHFVGIGGIGMSALARLYLAKGHEVTGSDATDSPLLERLRDEGMGVFMEHSGLQVAPDTALVVYSEAIPLDNLELQAARERNISCKTYFEVLGEWTAEQKTICIAGSHGKTTTTALIARLLMHSYRDPTVVIGTQMRELEGKNMRLGGGEWMVVEACEYRRSFLHLQPQVVVLTNIELDHLDYYKNEKDYVSAFEEFVAKLPADGILVANADDANVRMVAEKAPCQVIYFDKTSSHLEKLELGVPGHHNKMNALAAFHVGLALGIEQEPMVEALNGFEGSWRRFEFKGHCNGADIYDDYAHHPTEIQATLQGAREKYPDHRLIAVFQPHQYSRTKHFLKEFGKAFDLADEVIIPNIYKVRDVEADVSAVSAERLVEEIQKHNDEVRLGGGLEATVADLKLRVGPNDLVLVMGAGDVWQVAEGLISVSK
jgi:UDP-N-acetylmuramate--alanine ligase